MLDDAHIGHINGALGTIRYGDVAPRTGWLAKLRTLLAILGPGLIVMVGNNDAGAFGTYSQAGQDYGTTLLWTLALLIPVRYVNREMVLPLGAVTGVGHTGLIIECFRKFWGAFSVIDLFLLNVLNDRYRVHWDQLGARLSRRLKAGAGYRCGRLDHCCSRRATFAGHPESGAFSDAGGVAFGLKRYVGKVPAVLFALARIDACIIGAAAVSLSTAYAIGERCSICAIHCTASRPKQRPSRRPEGVWWDRQTAFDMERAG